MQALTPDQIKRLELKRQYKPYEARKAQPQYGSGEAVMIHWENNWYSGFVVDKTEGRKFKVHYCNRSKGQVGPLRPNF